MPARSPLVLITADRLAPDPAEPIVPNAHGRVRPARPKAWVYEAYVQAVQRAGGTALVVPPGPSDIAHLLQVADAVVLTGGDMDIHPSHYGQAVAGRLDRVEPARTALELELARACLAADTPVLGICGGMQVLAVAAGGTLIQDLPVPDPGHPDRIRHEQPNDPAEPSHGLRTAGPATAWLGARTMVNSTHHQAVDHLGSFSACGWADDDVVEAIHLADHRFAAGLQWHPELLDQLGAYRALIDAARGR